MWRVCWNMLATMLISTGDDGCVRIWRSMLLLIFTHWLIAILYCSPVNYSKKWKCAAVLKAEGSGPPYEPALNSPSFTTSAAATAKYYKKGIISNPNQVPWHWNIKEFFFEKQTVEGMLHVRFSGWSKFSYYYTLIYIFCNKNLFWKTNNNVDL